MIKRIIAAMLICLLFAAPAFAAGNDMPHRFPDLTESAEIAPDEVMADLIGVSPEVYRTIREKLYDAIRNFEDEADISEFGLEHCEDSETAIYSMLLGGEPLFYYLNDYEVIPAEDGTVEKVCFDYDFEKGSRRHLYYEETIEKVSGMLLDGIEGNDSLTDIQKALLLHDRLASYCNFTKSYLLSGTDNAMDHSLIGAFVRKECVCQGYAYAYRYLLNRAGIRNYYSLSEELNHIWNAVYIDGIPYYVDVTWDDNLDKSAVYHLDFMCSYGLISELGHSDDFELYEVENHDEYDRLFWRKSISQFVLLDGEVYYIDSVDCTLNKWVGDERIKVADVPGGWSDRNVQISWVNTYSVLETDGDYLYYSTPYTVVRFNPRTGTTRTVYTYEPGEDEMFFNIYGFDIDGDDLYVDVLNSPSYLNFVNYGSAVIKLKFEVADIAGDADGDGNVTMKDVLLIRRGLAGAFDLKGKEALCADYDGNGDLNLKDVLAVRKALAGAE